MSTTSVIFEESAVNEYIERYGLQRGSHVLEAVLLQLQGTVTQRPCAMLIAEVEGKKRVIKTTLDTLDNAVKALRAAVAAAGGSGPPVQPPTAYLAQIAELFQHSFKQDLSYAWEWLTTPHRELEDCTPFDVIAQGHGRVVVDMLAAASWGIPT